MSKLEEDSLIELAFGDTPRTLEYIESLKCCGNCAGYTCIWMECTYHPAEGDESAEEYFPYSYDHCVFTPSRWKERNG
jgi:hypothetical protein